MNEIQQALFDTVMEYLSSHETTDAELAYLVEVAQELLR